MSKSGSGGVRWGMLAGKVIDGSKWVILPKVAQGDPRVLEGVETANGGSNIPRADVSNGALAGALVALFMAVASGQTDLAVYGPLISVVLQFFISYMVPAQYKVAANGVGGAIVTIVVVIINYAQGLEFNDGAFQTAVTALVTFILTLIIPPRQP